MSTRQRISLFLGIVVAVLLFTSAYAAARLLESHRTRGAAPTVATVAHHADPAPPSSGHIVFRHTGVDSEYGVVATVPLDDPGGPRTFTGATCDRVYANPAGVSCLATQRGVVTSYDETWLGPDWAPRSTAPLAGIPSRTRISLDGTLVSSTSFVSGHSYLAVGFSTATEIHSPGGTSYGNLERFRLIKDGTAISPTDRNVWGVTFAGDDRTFYATVGTRGHTYLVRGDLADRTLTVVADHVECPSLSPDGTRIAFKEAGTVDGRPGWTPAVLDLATGQRNILTGETRSVDDQLEWLDDDTVLYGLARPDEAGVTDVWSLDTAVGSRPQLLIEQAWSPSVVR